LNTPALFLIAQVFLSVACLCEPAVSQQSAPATPIVPARAAEPNPPRKSSPSLALDVYVHPIDNGSAEVTAAVMLFTKAGQIFRQGITKKGHFQIPGVAPAKYEMQVIAPGFDSAVQDIDASGTGEIQLNVQLKPQTGGEKSYPAISSDPEVDYVFGLYASRLGDWEQAKSYWAKVLQLLPEHVPAIVSISEVLLNQNKALEAMEYLVHAEKLDPTYWRTQAVLAEIALRAGSTAEAVHHAERAIELGREEAAGVSPLLARALVARANEVLQTYLKDHPEDVAARKQLRGLAEPWELRSPEPPNADVKEGSAVATTAKPAARSGGSRWLPPDVDENVPPVEPGAACNLEEVLEKAGKKIQEFVGNVDRFTATESLLHETFAKSGNVVRTEKRKYDYVVSISQLRPGYLDLEEYESSGSTPADSPGGMTTRGLPALVLIFHPYYSGTFAMKCEGLTNWNGKRTWQIYFRQRGDKPNKIRAYRVGLNSHPVALKGRAWIVADSYEVIGLQTDLLDGIPEIRLTAEHTAIQYGPVHFTSRGIDMWLPQTAEVYIERHDKRVHRRLSFSNYLLFAVDDKQQIAAPKTDP
jgi:tetratricopeptide (TPR) repeat protein